LLVQTIKLSGYFLSITTSISILTLFFTHWLLCYPKLPTKDHGPCSVLWTLTAEVFDNQLMHLAVLCLYYPASSGSQGMPKLKHTLQIVCSWKKREKVSLWNWCKTRPWHWLILLVEISSFLKVSNPRKDYQMAYKLKKLNWEPKTMGLSAKNPKRRPGMVQILNCAHALNQICQTTSEMEEKFSLSRQKPN